MRFELVFFAKYVRQMTMWIDSLCRGLGRCNRTGARKLEFLGGESVRVSGGILSIFLFEGLEVLFFYGFVFRVIFKFSGEESDFFDLGRLLLNLDIWIERYFCLVIILILGYIMLFLLLRFKNFIIFVW